MLLSSSWYLWWLSKASTTKEFVKGEINEIKGLDQTHALELCYSWVAEWSPADPDDDEVWDSSRREWKKPASRLHWKWCRPRSYTPGQVSGERRKILHPYPRLFLKKKKLSLYIKRNAVHLGLREVPVWRHFTWEPRDKGFIFLFLDHKWLT